LFFFVASVRFVLYILSHENETDQKIKGGIGKKKTVPAMEAAPVATTPTSVPSPVVPGIIIHEPNGEMTLLPPPEALLREAEQEPNYRALDEYSDTIETLREKGFSYREISEWFKERGVDIDHNAVYRIYTKFMSEETLREESLQEHYEEEELRHRIH
jgi:hypothetical protein